MSHYVIVNLTNSEIEKEIKLIIRSHNNKPGWYKK